MKKNYILLSVSSLTSILLCILFYKLISPKISAPIIKELYIGYSLLMNNNKYLDVSMFFIYILITFALFFAFNRFSFKTGEIKFFEILKQKIQNLEPHLLKHLKLKKRILLKFQIFGILGYFLLYPYDGNIYPTIIFLILFFVFISVIDYIKTRNKNFSPLCIAPFIFIFLSQGYNNPIVSIDDHHLGEKIAVYFMHAKYGLEYYKDIMLVHGHLDVLPAYLGQKFFGSLNLYSFLQGFVFTNNLLILASLILLLYVFNSPIFLAFGFFTFNSSILFMFGSFLLLLKENIFKKPFLLSMLYIFFAFLFCSYWTTIGTFWAISAFPLFIYSIYKIIQKSNYRFLKILTILAAIASLVIFNFETLKNYITQAQPYIKGNLIVFGNGFNFMNTQELFPNLKSYFAYFTKYFVLIFTPFLIYDFIQNKNDKKEENTDIKNSLAQKNTFLIFAIICPIVSISYTFGRIDFDAADRLNFLSCAYITIFLLYFLIGKINSRLLKSILTIIFVISIFLNLGNTFEKIKNISFKKPENTTILYDSNGVYFNNKHKIRLEKTKLFIDKYSKANDTFLDLNNRGMHYFYFNRKIPINFISFYNSISKFQDEQSLEQLKNNPPKVILLYSTPKLHDGVKFAIRMNKSCKWILNSKMYSLKKDDNLYALVLDKKTSKFKKEELAILDDTLANSILEYLPDIWAKSIKNLPLEKTDIKYKLQKESNKLTINFNENIKGGDFDFIHVDTKNKIYGSYKIKQKNSKFIMSAKTKTGNILIPFDIVPSWFLSDKIESLAFIFEPDVKIENINISFYKRK